MRKWRDALIGVFVALVYVVLVYVAFIYETQNPGELIARVTEVASSVTQFVSDATGGEDKIELVEYNVPLSIDWADGVHANGWLRVEGSSLLNEAGQPIALRGMSSHGIKWYPEYTTPTAIASTKSYGANVFRAAMYPKKAPGANQGADSRVDEAHADNLKTMSAVLDNALSLDMYAIADWHILEEQNPLNLVDEAVRFFDELSTKYAAHPGVIYEICNEPNGDTTWSDICEYAHRVIPVIRKNSPNAVILVGTPAYSSDLAGAISSPLSYDNIMYTYHYYTGYHAGSYVPLLTAARDAGIAVFVSEWGVGADGAATEDHYELGRQFVNYLCDEGYCWVNWSLSNKDECYSAILPNVVRLSNWTSEHMTESGKLAFDAFSA